MKKLTILILVLSFPFIFSSPAWAKIPTGVCCTIGHPEECPQDEYNYVCDRPTSPDCENQSKGECMLVGPYEGGRSSLEKFQDDLEQPGVNLSKYIGGEDLVNPQGFTGTLGTLINASTALMVGLPKPLSDGSAQTGAVGAMGKTIAMLYQKPPASSTEYLAYMGEKAGFTPKAYAQGVGFRGFFPLIKVWSVMRNTAYLFFAFIFIVVGLLIIFRVRIDPRTVVTIQAALPRIVISLLLVTFSYAIVGLLVDVMNIVIGIFVWLFHLAGLVDVPSRTISELQTNNVLAIIFKMFGGEIFFCGIPLIGPSEICQVAGWGPGWAIGEIIRGSVGGIVGAVTWIGMFLGGNSIIEWIFAIALAVSIFRLFFNLIMAYVSVILSVILGPLQIAFNAIPNWNTFKSWIMGILANLAVFPTIAGMLMLGAALTGKSGGLGVSKFPGMEETGWWPPLIGRGGESAEPILLLIGYGIILMTPGMVDRVKKLFQVPPAEMPMIGAAIGAGRGAVQAPVSPLVTHGRYKGYEALEKRGAKAGPRVGLIFKGLGRIIKPPRYEP